MVNTGSEELWDGLRQGDNMNAMGMKGKRRHNNVQDSISIHEP